MRLACCLLLLSLGCRSTSGEDTPGRPPVAIASTFGEVAGCTNLGPVESSAQSEEAAISQMLNRTAAKGGNVLYVHTAGVKPGRSGVAYRCAF